MALNVSGDPGDARYAAVWVERPGPAWWAVHGLDAAACQARFDELTGQGYAPTILTATGPASGEIFAAAFEQGVDQPWFARHGLRWDPDTLTHENSRAYDQGYLPRCLACTETPRTGASPASGSRTSTPCCAVLWWTPPGAYQRFYDALVQRPRCDGSRSCRPGCRARCTPAWPPASRPPAKAAAPERPVIRFRDIVRSELIKFRSTRPGPLIVAASLVADADTGMLFG